MSKALDTPIGIYHFLFDRIPGGIPTVAPRPRTINVFKKNDKALVAKVKAGPSVKDAVGQALSLLGGLSLAVKRGDKVVVKPNFNSPDPFPASTDLEFLSVVTQMLLDVGPKSPSVMGRVGCGGRPAMSSTKSGCTISARSWASISLSLRGAMPTTG